MPIIYVSLKSEPPILIIFPTLNPLTGTFHPHSDTVIGTLAVDGWAVAFGTARKGLGGLRPPPNPVPSSLYQT